MRDEAAALGARSEAGFDDYTASRWATVVRTAVLLGVPPSAAVGLAAEATARARSGLARGDSGSDPDVELFAELLEAHRRDRRCWWLEPPTEDDLAAALAQEALAGALDRLTPAARADVVLCAVAQLSLDQRSQVLGAGAEDVPADLVAEVAAVAETVVVPDSSDAVLGSSSDGRTRRRAVSTLAVACTVALAMLAGLTASARLGAGDPVAQGRLPLPARSSTDFTVTVSTDPVPVPFYANGILRLGDRLLSLSGVVALHSVPGGLVAETVSGRVLLVYGRSQVTVIGRTARGAPVAASASTGLVAWIGRGDGRELSLYDTGAREIVGQVDVEASSEVAAVLDDVVYVNDFDGHLRVGVGSTPRRVNGVRVLDVVGDLVAAQPTPERVQLLADGVLVQTLPGTAVDLSPDGRFSLLRGTDDPATYRLLDTVTGFPIELGVPEGIVTDATFVPDGGVVLVVRGPLKEPGPDRDDPALTPRRSTMVRCDIADRSCEVLLRVGGAITGPVLAH